MLRHTSIALAVLVLCACTQTAPPSPQPEPGPSSPPDSGVTPAASSEFAVQPVAPASTTLSQEQSRSVAMYSLFAYMACEQSVLANRLGVGDADLSGNEMFQSAAAAVAARPDAYAAVKELRAAEMVCVKTPTQRSIDALTQAQARLKVEQDLAAGAGANQPAETLEQLEARTAKAHADAAVGDHVDKAVAAALQEELDARRKGG